MHLHTHLKRLRNVDHQVHSVTLVVVVVSAASQAAAAWLPKLSPEVRVPHRLIGFLAEALHVLHGLAVFALVLYAVVYFAFSRKPSLELAEKIPKPRKAPAGVPADAAADAKKPGGPYTNRGRAVEATDVAFVGPDDEALAEILFAMNHDGFVQSSFELTPSEVAARDTALIARNPHGFMLLRDPVRETDTPLGQATRSNFIGYSCVLPLNDVGTQLYTRGLISDKDFPEVLLAPASQPADSLLLFALYLERDYRAGTAGARYVVFLARAVEHHIRLLAQGRAAQSPPLEVWAQSEDERLREHLVARGFVKTDKLSKDGFPLYKRTLAGALAAAAPVAAA